MLGWFKLFLCFICWKIVGFMNDVSWVGGVNYLYLHENFDVYRF